MFETGRRSAISSSELGLYSDRSEYYNRNKYGPVVKKFVIGVMAVVAVILAAIFIYDFASGSAANSKVSQETKHVYILQNALKKPGYFSKKPTTTTMQPESEKLTSSRMQERSDNDRNLSYIELSDTVDDRNENLLADDLKPKSQNLLNFKMRQKLLDHENKGREKNKAESKEIFNNHAVVYRVRQMYKYPDPGEEMYSQESSPKPFHFKMKTPEPASFKRLKYPQLSQYQYPHSSRNIQDIIKYLINDPESTKHGIKFTGVYTNPKKSDIYSDISEIINGDRTEMSDEEDDETEEEEEEEDTSHITITHHHDPFYQYKPKHPADVNLLAPANVRFSPAGLNRYNPYVDQHPQFHRPHMMMSRPSTSNTESTYDNTGAYSGYGTKKKKPKPFSVMLDIYPITDLNDHTPTKITSRPRPASAPIPEESNQDPRFHYPHYHSEHKRPLISPPYKRGVRYVQTPIPIVAFPASQPGLSDDDEKKQMIFHLNLYPRRKGKLNRKDILQKSEGMLPQEHKDFMKKIMTPLELLTKQITDLAAIENIKFTGTDNPNSLALTKYQESFLEMPNEESDKNLTNGEIPNNHRKIEVIKNTVEDQSAGSPKALELLIPLETEKTPDCEKIVEQNETLTRTTSTSTTDVDTIEGFQKFADGLVSAT